MRDVLILFCAIFHSRAVWGDGLENTELRMPGVAPETGDVYLCTSISLDPERPHFLVGFTPHASMHTAHHMLMYGCSAPGSDKPVWNCGEMHREDSEFEAGPVCNGGEQIMYAWARDAPEFNLPAEVGFKVGGDTQFQHLVLQIHYMHAVEEPDTSGISLHSTDEPMPKEAHVILMATNGGMAPKTKENFDTMCVINEDVELHPFAFRTHTHKHGKVVSGWRVRDNQWSLLGKRDPMTPQMFYPVANASIVIEAGDALAARCHMANDENKDVYIGPSGEDEMCNFYMMYWTEPDNDVSEHSCVTDGPPVYRWQEAGLENIPKNTEVL